VSELQLEHGMRQDKIQAMPSTTQRHKPAK